MKKMTRHTLIIIIGMAFSLNANAQFGDLLQKAKDKAVKKASDQLDKQSAPPSDDQPKKTSRVHINEGFDFVQGDTLLFAEDFANTATGASTTTFKTNGSASVATIDGQSGKWLALADNATYKLSKQLFYPKHFTLQFDIFAAADEIRDIYPVYVGFINDNSVKGYNSGQGAYMNLQYYNSNDITISSSFNSKYLNTHFDLTNYANRPMHVSIEVDGERMVIYLDKTKLADTQLFLPATAKNFYVSGPMQYKNGAKVLVSNFKIMGFKNAK